MELENKAKATLQELLDVVRGYREAAERAEHEASRVRVECEAWRSRATEEGRRNARLRRILATATQVTSKLCIPSLRRSARRGLKFEDMSYQFGSVLALALAFSGPGAQAAADQGSLQHGTGDAGRSSASLSAAATAATCAVTFTALAASPRSSLHDTSSLQTSSSSLGLMTISPGFQEQPGARAGRSPGRQEAGGGSDRGDVGSGPQVTCAGADSGTRNTSCSSLSSMGAGAGPGSSSNRGHSRAGFKLVLRGGNGDSASLRQLSTYNAMFPPTAGKSAGGRGGGGVGGAVKVHESYSACELSSAGTASGSMAASSSLAGTGSASTSGDITTVAACSGGRVGIGGRSCGAARVSERERAARAHSASCAVPEAQLALPVAPLPVVVGAGAAMEGGPGGSSPDSTNSASWTPTSRGTVATATSLSSEAREMGAASGMTQGPHGLRQQHQVKAQPGEGVLAAPGTSDLARISGSSDDEQVAAELGIATATSEPWPGCAGGLRVAAAPSSASSAPAPAAAPSRNSSDGDTPAFAAQPRAATAGPAFLHRGTAGAQAASLAARLSPELALGRTASAGSSPAPAAVSGPSHLQSSDFERPAGPSGVTQLPLYSMHHHHQQQHHLCAPRGALDTLPEVHPSASLQHLKPLPSAPAAAAAGLGPGPVGRTQSVVYSRSQLPAALLTAAIPRRETVPAGSGASFQEELSWHAGILHKQRTKLQDDLASITQSSNLIRCNRATCNLAPGSPQQPLALGSPTRMGSSASLPLMLAPPHSAAPAATLSPFGAAAAAELAAAREATAEAATAGGAGGDGAFSAVVAAAWPEAQLPPRFCSGPATMTPPVAADGSTAIPGADLDASRLDIPIPATSAAAEEAAAPLQRPPSSASPSEPSCATCQAMSPEPAFVALYWVTPPAAALVVTKPSPGVRPTFERVLSWLHQRGVATYVEPSMVRSWPGLSCARPPPRFRSDGGDGVGYGGSEGGEESMEEVDEGKDGPQMPGCYTGVPMLLSWPADEGDDCHSQMVPPDVAAAVDFVVVLGGDGTVLWTCHIFGNQSVPPVIPFNLGSLGFLTPFDPAHAEEVLGHVMEGGFPIMLRHRLHCHIIRSADACAIGLKACAVGAGGGGAFVDDGVPASDGCGPAGDTYASAVGGGGDCSPAGREWVVLNEVVIDRGISSFLGSLECYCDGAFVTHVQGDGLIVATPTGSTAYNLAAGGSMVHPQVPGILFTPICPHSLSFRPLIFPDHVSLCVQVPASSRSQMWCSFDGKDRQALNAGDAVVIRMSAWPVPTVCSKDASRDWFSGVREGLHWNMRRLQAGAGQ